MTFAARSIPLLQDAIARTDDKEQRESARFTLFESYLDTGDWKQAEAVFPDAALHLTGRELPSWQGRIAELAARAGAKDDALRIWKSVANVNPCYLGSVGDLARAGLTTELREFYKEFGVKLPSSVVPLRAMKIIEDSQVP
jgi:hypothetical protein